MNIGAAIILCHMDEQASPPRTLSIREAAHHFGLGETTIRRRIQHGELQAFKQQTVHGVEWRVVIPAEVGGGVSTTGGGVSTTHASASENATTLHSGGVSATGGGVSATGGGVSTTGTSNDHVALALVEENRRLQDQALQLAGRIGWLEAQLQQANEHIKLLTDTQHAPGQLQPGLPEAEPSPQPSEQLPKQAPWWKRLLGM